MLDKNKIETRTLREFIILLKNGTLFAVVHATFWSTCKDIGKFFAKLETIYVLRNIQKISACMASKSLSVSV